MGRDAPSILSAVAERLGDFVRAYMEAHGLNDRVVAQRSRRFITHPTVATVRNGKANDPKYSTFQGLAYGLGLPIEVLMAAAIGKPLVKSEDVKQLQAELYFTNLPLERQDDALMLLRAFFTKYGQNTAEVVKITRNLSRRKVS